MTEGSSADVLLYLLLLLLPLAALLARRPSFSRTLKMLLAWVVIFAIGVALVGHRDRLPSLSALDGDQQTVGHETRVRKAQDGHFWVKADIDGVSRRMLVDSGATSTALSVGTARAISLDLNESPFPIVIETSNGPITARVATVKRLAVGSVVATNLGVVVSPAFRDNNVLGMNFLSRLASGRVQGDTLILVPNAE